MSTPITAAAGGFFVQLMPLLTDRTLMVIVCELSVSLYDTARP